MTDDAELQRLAVKVMRLLAPYDAETELTVAGTIFMNVVQAHLDATAPGSANREALVEYCQRIAGATEALINAESSEQRDQIATLLSDDASPSGRPS